jgi:sulfite oxidase
VDLTGDGGQTWTEAHRLEQDTARHPRHWGWTLWEGRVPLGEGGEVWSKAVDSSFNVQVTDGLASTTPPPFQPESFENIWNLRGVLSNAYCRVKVEAAPPA